MEYANFQEIINKIYEYYKMRGYTMSSLAYAIGVDLRTLQMWKSGKKKNPHKTSMELLKDFLANNGGNHFILALSEDYRIIKKTEDKEETAIFPNDLSDTDIDIIKNNFPAPEELSVLCAMTIYKNLPLAISEVLPNGDLAERASLVSRYEVALERAKETFGIGDIYTWKAVIIQYIERIPSSKCNLEEIGQNAINHLCECYRIQNKIKEEKQNEESA